jgi:hypothetical protein
MKNIKPLNEMLGASSGSILVSIYKSEGRSFSGGGFTSRTERAMLVWGDAKPPAGEDYLVVMTKNVGSDPYVYCVPKSMIDKKQWPMMGGCFAYTSDSRFRQGVCQYPIPIHDRYEP